MASKMLLVVFLLVVISMVECTVVTTQTYEKSEESQVISSLPDVVAKPQNRNQTILVLKWTPSYCALFGQSAATCFITPYQGPFFDIQDMSTASTSDPITIFENCNGPVFNPNTLTTSILDYMHVYWPSLTNANGNITQSNLDNWSAVWATVGTCTGLSQREYFNAIVKIYRKYEFEVALNAAGIVPDNEKLYNVDDIVKALSSHVGHRVRVYCNAIPTTQGGFLFSEVFVGYSIRERKVVDCENVGPFECPAGTQVLFPPPPCPNNVALEVGRSKA
ncbi:unnamed protein product [Sphagnum compactum]